MALSDYHKNYVNRSDEAIERRMAVKKVELEAVLSRVNLHLTRNEVRVAVLGCGDRRFVQGHINLFSHLLGKRVDLTTFDITIDHLTGEDGIVKHDVTESLPGGLYDIIFGHVFLKFISTEQQWTVLKNAYKALSIGGIAVFVQGKQEREHVDRVENYGSHGAYQYKEGHLCPVHIEDLKKRMTDAGMEFIELNELIEGVESVAIEENILVIKK